MNKFLLVLFIFLGLTTNVFLVFAAIGTIDPVNKYAWSNNIGWINFGCTDCNISITDTAITGHAWSKDYGWINFNPTNGGVQNTTAGVLSGYAWGQSAGWINFTGASINSSGQFTGTATGSIVGTINFSCTESGCPVTTDWNPTTIVPVCGDGICNGGETSATCCSDCGGCGGISHTECTIDKKCISVVGSGTNQCTTDASCSACDPHGDLNRDTFINITDFSIMMFFWQDIDPISKCVDLNKDGNVDLVDFSIMLYWWTG